MNHECVRRQFALWYGFDKHTICFSPREMASCSRWQSFDDSAANCALVTRKYFQSRRRDTAPFERNFSSRIQTKFRTSEVGGHIECLAVVSSAFSTKPMYTLFGGRVK